MRLYWPAHADVAGGHVGVRADVLIQLGHEALAEAHDLHVALALGVEVAAALAAADGQAGQAVLQRLLEGQELHGVLGHRGVQPQAALVGADGAVALYAVAAVHVHIALVVNPRHAELDHALLLHEQLKHARLHVFRMLLDHGLDGFQNAPYGDQELLVVRVALFDAVHQIDQVCIFQRHFVVPLNDGMKLSPKQMGIPALSTACVYYNGKAVNLQYYSLLNCKFKCDAAETKLKGACK